MKDNKKFAVLMLVLGLVVGFSASYLTVRESYRNSVPQGMHMMGNGKYMSNSSMGGMMMDMTDGLVGKSGDEFDKAFLDEMIVHHEGAVDMAKLVLENSKRTELLNLANNIIDAQTKEISMMKQWRQEWFK